MRDVGANEAFMRRTARKRPSRKGRASALGTRLEGAVDNLVGVFSPRAKLRRLLDRKAYELAAGAYQGARRNRLNEGWLATEGSADSDLLPDLPTLRDRSRELFRNDGLARGIAKTIVDNVVGSGIRPHPNPDRQFLGISDMQAEDFQDQALGVWDRWCKEADAGRRMGFYALQRLACYHRIIDGEILSLPLMLEQGGRFLERACRIVDPALLEDPPGMGHAQNMRSGIELGAQGEPVRYWFRKAHRGDRVFQSENFRDTHFSVAARVGGLPGCIHVYEVLRAGQSRGEPMFSPVLDDFHDLRKYLKSERVAAEVAACITYWITGTNSLLEEIEGLEKDTQGNPLEDVYPGMVGRLNSGESIEQLAHDRPGTTFEPFVMRLIRQIGVAIGLSYGAISRDTSKSNFSNARTEVINDRKTYRYEQQASAIGFSDPYYRMVMLEAWLKRDLPAAGADFEANLDRWLRVDWIGEGWDWVDPLKDVQTAEKEIELGLNSRTRISIQRGRSFKAIQRELAAERDAIGEQPTGDSSTPVPVMPNGEDDDENDDDGQG